MLACWTPFCSHEGVRGGLCLQHVFRGTYRAVTRACPNTAGSVGLARYIDMVIYTGIYVHIIICHAIYVHTIYIYISLWDTAFGANAERFQGLVPLLPHLCPLSVPEVGVCGVCSESRRKGLFGDVWVRGGSGTIFFRKLAVTVDGLGFFACSGQVSDTLHCTPTRITPTYGHMRVNSFGWICCNMGPFNSPICWGV